MLAVAKQHQPLGMHCPAHWVGLDTVTNSVVLLVLQLVVFLVCWGDKHG
jgi:hypothetical protein